MSQRAAVAVGKQNKRKRRDAAAMSVGIVLFWPALFFIKGDGPQAAELANVKGQMQAIETVNGIKKCGIEFKS